MDKKGQLFLDSAQKIFIAFLILAITAIAVFLTVTNLKDVAENIHTVDATIQNETVTTVTELGDYLAYYPSDAYRNAVCTISYVSNATGGERIVSNWTTSESGCRIIFNANATGAIYNNTNWNVTYTVTYSDPASNDLSKNISTATTDFFDNTSTIFSIIIVVVIILAIFIVVRIVQGGGGTVSMGGRKEYGSGTVMGV